MTTFLKLATAGACLIMMVAFASAGDTSRSARRFALKTTAGLVPHNVSISAREHLGRPGVRVTMTDELRSRYTAMSPEERQQATVKGELEQFAVVEGLEFVDGSIEAEISGEPQTGVFEGARGFVGIAFRVQGDLRTYDAFYLRPTNGRADDQVRRNHSSQYISHPDWTWSRLRQEYPKKYESYVDLVPGEWTRIRIEVSGEQARLYVHGAAQPTLIVNDLKSGKTGRGAIALWIDVGTVAHFRNLVVGP